MDSFSFDLAAHTEQIVSRFLEAMTACLHVPFRSTITKRSFPFWLLLTLWKNSLPATQLFSTPRNSATRKPASVAVFLFLS